MGRTPCCDRETVKKGTWSAEEDAALMSYVQRHGGTVTNWISLPPKIGLNRCGKSCRLRWLNYLRPDIKRGKFTEEEDKVISELYFTIGSRWSVIADKLTGRTDNDIKNYWNTKLKRKLVGNRKKLRRRPSFAGFNGTTPPTLDDQINPAEKNVFTITNGHLMSTTWPSTSQLYQIQPLKSQDIVTGFGEHVPVLISFADLKVCEAYNNNKNSNNKNPCPPYNNDPHDQQMKGLELVNTLTGFDHTTENGHPCDFMTSFLQNDDGSTSQATAQSGGSTADININVKPGSILSELEELLFDNSPSRSPMMDGPDLLAHNTSTSGEIVICGESVGSWDDMSSLISLPMDNALHNSNCEEEFLPQDILDEFSYTSEQY